MRLRKRADRVVPYRTLPALQLPEDVSIPSCSQCKVDVWERTAQVALSPLLARLYAAELRRRIQSAIVTLSPVVSQRRLENLLGLSAGYLSRLKAGAGTPSPALALQLQQLALDPIPRLREIERIWGESIATELNADRSVEAQAIRTNPRRRPRPFT